VNAHVREAVAQPVLELAAHIGSERPTRRPQDRLDVRKRSIIEIPRGAIVIQRAFPESPFALRAFTAARAPAQVRVPTVV